LIAPVSLGAERARGSPLRRGDPVAVGFQQGHGGGQFRLGGSGWECRGRWPQFIGQPPVKAGVSLCQVPEGGAESVGDGAHVWVVRWRLSPPVNRH